MEEETKLKPPTNLPDRNHPAPGWYRAQLHDAQNYHKSDGKLCVRAAWILHNHPETRAVFTAQSFYGISKPGLLAKMLWDWKHLSWEMIKPKLVANPNFNPLAEFIGHEADIWVEDSRYRPDTSEAKLVYPPGTCVVLEPGIGYRVIAARPDLHAAR